MNIVGICIKNSFLLLDGMIVEENRMAEDNLENRMKDHTIKKYQLLFQESQLQNKAYQNMLKWMVNVLADYDLRHCAFPEDYIDNMYEKKMPFSSITIPGIKQIMIDNDMPEDKRRYSVLHELIRALHYMRKDLVKNFDGEVELETQYMFKHLYKSEVYKHGKKH